MNDSEVTASVRAPTAPGRAAVRLAAAILLASAAGGVAGAMFLLAGARWAMPASIGGPVADGGWTSRSRACFIADGFYSPEVDIDAERSFSWTRQTARLVLPRLDRSQPHRLSLRVAPGRPAGVTPPALRVAVDGAVLVSTEPSNDRRTVAVEIPPRAGTGAEVTLDVSTTLGRTTTGDPGDFDFCCGGKHTCPYQKTLPKRADSSEAL